MVNIYYMKKTRISSLIDYVFYYFCFFFISLIWIRFFVHNTAVILTISFILSTIFIVSVLKLDRKKKIKSNLNEKQKKLAEAFSKQMSFLSQKEESEKICNIFNINKTYIKKSCVIYKNCAIVPLFCISICAYDDILNNFIKLKNEKIEKIIFVANEFSDEALNFTNMINDIKIIFLDKFNFYKIIEPLNIKVETTPEIKTSKKEKFKQLLNVAFNKSKSKSYFIYGIILFICCLFFRYNVYYIIFSSLMFCFSIFSRFNKTFNIKKTNDNETIFQDFKDKTIKNTK